MGVGRLKRCDDWVGLEANDGQHSCVKSGVYGRYYGERKDWSAATE